MRDFAGLGENTWDSGVEFKIMNGQNHISPPAALLSGDVEGENWGEDVADWIKRLNN
jgi:hypothetical protein